MWQLVPPTVRIGMTVGAALLLGFANIYFKYNPKDFSIEKFSLIVLASMGTLYLVASTLGRLRLTWEIPFHKFILGSFFPNLNGVWLGEIRSTFPLSSDPNASLHESQMAMRITQTWFYILVETERKEGTSYGKSVYAIPEKVDNTPWIKTIYRGYAVHPQPGDDSIWFGASEFWYERNSESIIGRYCSNRSYIRRTPTAGDFKLIRVASNPTATVPWK